jgi:hypothetical protein
MTNVVDVNITAEYTRKSCINTKFSLFVPPVDFQKRADGITSKLAVAMSVSQRISGVTLIFSRYYVYGTVSGHQ